MSTVRSVITADDAADRIVLSVNDADDPSPDPGVTELGRGIYGADFLHIYVDLGGATSASITPWYYSEIAEQWFEGTQIVFTPGTGLFALVETRGEAKVFFVVDVIAGTGDVDIYAGYSFVEPSK